MSKRQTEEQFGIRFDSHFAESLRKLQEFMDDGIIEHREDAIVIRDSGRLVLRNIAMCFDAYVEAMGKNKPLFSGTV